MLTDLPLKELRALEPDRAEPADFDDFWESTLREARAAATEPTIVPVTTRSVVADTFDVTFSGYAGQPIKGWLRRPKNIDAPLPAVVEYIGYGGSRGLAFEPTVWSSAGFVHLIMDSRGQSSNWGSADTPDGDYSPQVGGVMTRGIESPDNHYYRRIFTDAVRALDVLRELPEVDEDRVATRGGSQGGALAIAATTLGTGATIGSFDVPFLCNIRRSTEITDSMPYRELTDYLRYRRFDVESVFETMSYFDCVNLAVRGRVPALFTAALMDVVCPPSGPFAAFNYWADADKRIDVWEFNDHEGGGPFQIQNALEFIADRLIPVGRP